SPDLSEGEEADPREPLRSGRAGEGGPEKFALLVGDPPAAVGGLIEEEPGGGPQEAEAAGEEEDPAPAHPVDEEAGHGVDGDGAEAGAGVEQAEREGPFARREPLGDRLARTGESA